MAAVHVSRLHIVHSCTVAAWNNFAAKKALGCLSKTPCALSSSSSVSRGDWVWNSKSVKVKSKKRLCPPVATALLASTASVGDAEDDGVSTMEWLSPTSRNPMEEWLRRSEEREGDAWREECGVVAHSGNLVNYSELRAKLEENGSIFNTSSCSVLF